MKNYPLINVKELDSTNNYASTLLLSKDKPQNGCVVFTSNQIKGKGLGSNMWESEPGKNLTFSIIYYPVFLHAQEMILLNMAFALSITDFLNRLNPELNVKIKWPNDIYINDKKVAGILIENVIKDNYLESSIAGIGININQTAFLSDAPNPTSLKLETSIEYDLSKSLDTLVECLSNRYKQLENNQKSIINDDYHNLLYRLNEFADYNFKDKTITAKMTGVNKYGRLQLIDINNNNYEFDVKEVEFII